jgi:hypothetical protein
MTPREMPNKMAMAVSAAALRFFRSRTDRAKPRPEITTMASADVHSRSPVTAAGGTCPNSRSARPAPNWTDTIPMRIMTAGSTNCPRPAPGWIFRKWTIRGGAFTPT